MKDSISLTSEFVELYQEIRISEACLLHTTRKNAVPGEVDAGVIFNLGLFQGPATSVFSMAALLLFLKYSLSREKHAEIAQELKVRRGNQVSIPESLP